MNELPRPTGLTLLMLLLVLSCAGGARTWYLAACTENGERDPALLVQDPWPLCDVPGKKPIRGRTPPTQLDILVENVVKDRSFQCKPQLAKDEELTAHQAPGYLLLFALVATWNDSADVVMRWLQCVLGTLTAGCYFLFARRAFHNTLAATLAGLLCAFHPFWIINTAELNDGVLISFLVGVSLALGARGGQVGGGLTSVGFGLALAGVALTRAALLPFAIVAMIWYAWQCLRFPVGWFAGFCMLFGFINGLGPWIVRNYQVYERPVPIATSTYLHLWIGNMPGATGAALDEQIFIASLTAERRETLLKEENQANRYNQLSEELWEEVRLHPTDTLARRINALLAFLLGERWLKQKQLGMMVEKDNRVAPPPSWLRDHAEIILHGTLLGILVLAFLGWRWSLQWRRYGGVAVIAVLFMPLPYVLSHAEHLSGPRLPLDGVLLTFAAYALANWFVHTPKSAARATQANTAQP